MKKLFIPLLALCASASFAADVTEKTTSTTKNFTGEGATTTHTHSAVRSISSTGTITEYEAGHTFTVKESSGPVHYHYGKSVEYVTRKGRHLSEDEVRTRVKIGIPVSVHYGTEGEHRVISRVVIDD